MNQKEIRTLLHHTDEQTAKQIAETYPATDNITKEKIYHQVCERRNAMNQQKKIISETYHTPDAKSVPWTRTFGAVAACILVMGGTIGGIWKLTSLKNFSENLNSTADNNTSTNSSETSPTESTAFSETLTTTQALAVVATSVTTTHTETNTTTISMITATTTKQTTSVTETTILQTHKETVAASETEQDIINTTPAPVITTELQVPATEPESTAPPAKTISTETEPAITKPVYLTAYLEICKTYEKEFDSSEYCLYDVDKDGTPELIINASYCWTSLYTYADNQIYTLMDKYPYGTHGNGGYYFHPEYNSIYYSYTEYAGLIANQVYLTITPEHTLAETDILISVMFDDLNQDGIPQENEPNVKDYDINYIGKYYHNGEEISNDEFDAWIMEHFQKTYINNRLDFKTYSDFLESLPE